MRIRRRPQPQPLIPSPYPPPSPQQASSDPSTTPPQNQHHCLPPRYKEEELHLYSPDNVDLANEPFPSTATRRAPLPPSHPQGDNVVGRSGDDDGGGGAQRQGAANGHGISLENGHRRDDEWPAATNAAAVVNGSATPKLNVKEKTAAVKSDGTKRRRGPAVLLEGSRCSRVNGRGWRCSQPTLVGYSLCEHHLGKGRQSRSGRSANGVPKLGRTEPPAASGRKKDLALAVVADATEPAAAQLMSG